MSVRIHNHSDYSNTRGLDCINKVYDIIDWSIKLGVNAAALTDHETMSGHYKFWAYAEKVNERGRKKLEANPNDKVALLESNFLPILGNEIYLTREGLNKQNHEKGERFYHMILLAKDRTGWEQLSELSSLAWDKMYRRGATRTPTYISELERVIGQDPGHIIATTACLGSYIGQTALATKDAETLEAKQQLYFKAMNFAQKMKSIFGEDFYLEIQPNTHKEQVYYNGFLRKLGSELDIKLVVATDAHYSRPEEKQTHWAYLTSQKAEREGKDFYATTYFMSDDEIADILTENFESEEVWKWITNTEEIADKIQRYSLKADPVIPKSPFKDMDKWDKIIHKYDHFEYFKIYSHSNDYDKFFLYQIICGLEEKVQKGWLNYADSLPRIDIELQQVWEVSKKLNQNMSTYFTTFQGLIEQIWKVSIVAPGRGSAAAFLINFCLDITQVNPLTQAMEFPYWRFLAAEKVSLPDIDIDFSSSKRPDVLKVVSDWLEEFGSIVSNIVTFGTEKSKSAMITSARAIGLDTEDGLYFSSMIPSSRGQLWTLKECYYGDGDSKKPIPEFVQAMNDNPDLWEIAQKIEGLINRRGVHPAGIVIFEKDKIYQQSALMRAPKGVITTQFSLDDLEEMGCVKYDLLSTEGLDAIETELYLLTEYGYIDWQDTLKSTYEKYLHPEVLNYTEPSMWEKVHRKLILKLFQLIG